MEKEASREKCDSTLEHSSLEVEINEKAWKKIMGWCRATDLEVSGFFLYEQDESVFNILDAYIVPQISTGSSTEIDGTASSKLLMRLIKDETLKNGRMLGHFHTHSTFGVFWSGTDQILRQTLKKGSDFYLSMVVNQKGEYKVALDVNVPFEFSIDDLPMSVVENSTSKDRYKKDVEENVKQPVVIVHEHKPTTQLRWWEQEKLDERLRAPMSAQEADDMSLDLFAQENGIESPYVNMAGVVMTRKEIEEEFSK